MRVVAWIGLFVSVSGYAAPPCQVHEATRIPDAGNAGCMIVQDGKMLSVLSRRVQKLGPPAGGSDPNESAQCTAYRETWEESGVVVTVGRLLKKFDNDFYLFECTPQKELAKVLPVPASAIGEVTRVEWINPLISRSGDWRFPDQFVGIKEAFLKVKKD